MAAIGFFIRVLALIVMYFISNPTILKLRTPEDAQTLRMRVFDKKDFNYQQPVYKQTLITNEGPQSHNPQPGGRSWKNDDSNNMNTINMWLCFLGWIRGGTGESQPPLRSTWSCQFSSPYRGWWRQAQLRTRRVPHCTKVYRSQAIKLCYHRQIKPNHLPWNLFSKPFVLPL